MWGPLLENASPRLPSLGLVASTVSLGNQVITLLKSRLLFYSNHKEVQGQRKSAFKHWAEGAPTNLAEALLHPH